jgi:tRNA pseudouridine38-40 synthase
MARWRLDIAYDGTNFSGWARQPGQRTVQEVCEVALAVALGSADRIGLHCAGRTDAGVHARGQVAHADIAGVVDPQDLLRRMAGLLPNDVALRACTQVTADFDARFSAMFRRYSYVLVDDVALIDPVRRHTMVWHRRRLNIEAMNTAAALLLGEHDFAAFCKTRPYGTTVRTLQVCSWSRTRSGAAVLDIRADAFCRSMVRGVVGALVPVGNGRQPPEWVGQVLASRRKDPRVIVMPAAGLTLEQVGYPPPEEWAAQQTVTRVRRDRPEGGSDQGADRPSCC